MIDRPIVVLLGAPGAGKGTQAGKLATLLNFEHLSTGEVLRGAVQRKNRLGKQVKEIMDAGELVPDELVSGIVRERIKETSVSQGVVLDGYPRNLSQAKFLDKMVGDQPMVAVNIQVHSQLLLKRLTGRRRCPDCGRTYNAYFLPPQSEGICDGCGSELTCREDDYEEVVLERLRVYLKQTAPMIELYSKRRSYWEVNGEQDPDFLSKKIVSKLMSEFRTECNSSR